VGVPQTTLAPAIELGATDSAAVMTKRPVAAATIVASVLSTRADAAVMG
jgi:hypothetical protein